MFKAVASAELEFRASRRGTTIDLARGNIIVHAADQRGGRLFVATNDCEIAVNGWTLNVQDVFQNIEAQPRSGDSR